VSLICNFSGLLSQSILISMEFGHRSGFRQFPARDAALSPQNQPKPTEMYEQDEVLLNAEFFFVAICRNLAQLTSVIPEYK
jgi:hypothetical protein